jgi:manganese/zinc/iron transport system permease protein
MSSILKQLQKLVFGQFQNFRNSAIVSYPILTIWGNLRSLNFGALEPPKCQFLKCFEYTINPYSGKTFIGFFFELFHRLSLFLSGQISVTDLATDELQICALLFIAISSTLLGTFLVLKRVTMLANSLSHTILLGIVLSVLFIRGIWGSDGYSFNMTLPTLLLASLLTALVTTFLTHLIHSGMRLQEDASIGLVFTILFALGIILVTVFTRSTRIGIEAIMGNVDALHVSDMKLCFSLLLITVILIAAGFKRLEIITFDPTLARSFGISAPFFNTLLMILTAMVAIGAFRVIGVFLFLAFLVGPVLSARFFAHRLKSILFLASFLGLVISLFSVALSRHIFSVYQMPLSTSGLAVVSIAIVFVGCWSGRRLWAR